MTNLLIVLICLVGVVSLRLYSLRSYYRWEVGYTYPSSRKRVGYIYFFRGKREFWGNIKIGRATDPVQRLRSHRTANPYGVKVVGVLCVHNDVRAEKSIHTRFATQRLKRDNEWFRLSLRLWLYMLLVRDGRLTRIVQGELDNEHLPTTGNLQKRRRSKNPELLGQGAARGRRPYA